MDQKVNKTALGGAIGAILAGTATLAVAPAALAGTAGPCPAVGASTGCNLTITLNANGTATIANGSSPGNYDNSDDTLIGVINNSGHTVNSIHLSASSSSIFAFDSDGVGTAGPLASTSYVGLGLSGDSGSSHGSGYSGTDSQTGSYDLNGPLNSFSNIVGNTGDVVFGSSGLANGSSAFFSLEEPLNSASFTATSSVPEPGSLGIFGAGLAGLVGFGLLRRRPDKS